MRSGIGNSRRRFLLAVPRQDAAVEDTGRIEWQAENAPRDDVPRERMPGRVEQFKLRRRSVEELGVQIEIIGQLTELRAGRGGRVSGDTVVAMMVVEHAA